MNNEQNNILGGLDNNIQPMILNTNALNNGNQVHNDPAIETIPGANFTPIGMPSTPSVDPVMEANNSQVGVVPVTAVVSNEQSNVVANASVSNPIPMGNTSNDTAGQFINVSPVNLNSNHSVSSNAVNNMVEVTPTPFVTPQAVPSDLKIETTTPFDIGITNSTVSAGVNPMPSVMSTSSVSENGNITPLINAMPGPILNASFPAEMQTNNSNPENKTDIQNDYAPLTNPVPGNGRTGDDSVVSVGKYLGYLILSSIPIIGFIVVLIKAFINKDKNIKNLARAQLILSFIMIILVVLLFIVIFTLGMGNLK